MEVRRFFEKSTKFIRSTLLAGVNVFRGTVVSAVKLGYYTVIGTVKLGYYTVIGAVKLGYYTVVGTVKLGYYTVTGALKLGYFTAVGSFKLMRATVRQTVRGIQATIRFNIRLFKAWMRRMRFEYVILLNLYHAPYMILKLKHWSEHPERYSETQRFMLAKRVIYYLSRTGHIKTFVTGRVHLPKDGGYVMYPNHQGKYDALAIMKTHPGTCTVVMDEKKSHTILTSQFLDAIGGKRLEIDNPRQTVKLFNEIAQELREGRRYIIFPEGGYKNENSNTLGEFKPGSFKAAIKAKVPIVPVALIDSYRAFNSAWLGPVAVYVHYLKPIFYEEYKSMTTAEIAALVRKRIEDRVRTASAPEVRKMLQTVQST